MSVARSLIKGAEEALAIAKGELEPGAVFVPETIDVAAVRKRQKLSQVDFARLYGLPLGTLKDWEQKRRSPDRAATVLLMLIEQQPELVVDTLRKYPTRRDT